MRLTSRWRRGLAGSDQSGALIVHLLRRADAMRERRRFAEAAVLYGEAGEVMGPRAEWLVLQGHMFEAAGQLAAAERAFEQALSLDSGEREAEAALAQLRGSGWAGTSGMEGRAGSAVETVRSGIDGASGLSHAQIARLVPELAPKPRTALLRDHDEELQIHRFGRRERGYWGNARTMRGVEAIRGYCISRRPLVSVELRLNGLVIHTGPLEGGYELRDAKDFGVALKYVFNIWLDVGAIAPGRYFAQLLCRDIEEQVRSIEDHIVVAEPLSLDETPGSDTLVPLSDSDAAALESAIRALPSVVRPARRTLFPVAPRNVLVMRTDQLGDLISSISAVRRLRELLPQVRIVGLFTAANGDLARALALFDEVVVIDFPDDAVERRRLMPLADQEALREKLATYRFDLAIDLAESDVSRPLLLLSGAPFLYGVGGGDWPWLTAEFGLSTHDRLNRLDRVPHSTKTLAMIETLGAMMRSGFETQRREDLDRRRLEPFGLPNEIEYVVLHLGARIAFSRWPRFVELALMVLARTGLHVVMMTDDASLRSALPETLRESPRFHLFDQRLAFDDFDALISYCTCLVGNDSGPKHLAALRNVPVVTLFTARINWLEWAQEEVGTVITRRVPCAGCAIFHQPEECGKGFSCIRDIRPEEVFDAMQIDLKTELS